jgi:3-oxoacyl-[acyl-carrier protein] reductase
LHDNVAIITGGARGIGAAIATRDGADGALVALAVFLASADADYVVGQTLNVDGGQPVELKHSLGRGCVKQFTGGCAALW